MIWFPWSILAPRPTQPLTNKEECFALKSLWGKHKSIVEMKKVKISQTVQYIKLYLPRTHTQSTYPSQEFTVYTWQRVSKCVCCIYAVPEYAVRCGEIKSTTIWFFNISYIHLNGCDTHSYTMVLEEEKNLGEWLNFMLINIIWNCYFTFVLLEKAESISTTLSINLTLNVDDDVSWC